MCFCTVYSPSRFGSRHVDCYFIECLDIVIGREAHKYFKGRKSYGYKYFKRSNKVMVMMGWVLLLRSSVLKVDLSAFVCVWPIKQWDAHFPSVAQDRPCASCWQEHVSATFDEPFEEDLQSWGEELRLMQPKRLHSWPARHQKQQLIHHCWLCKCHWTQNTINHIRTV